MFLHKLPYELAHTEPPAAEGRERCLISFAQMLPCGAKLCSPLHLWQPFPLILGLCECN